MSVVPSKADLIQKIQESHYRIDSIVSNYTTAQLLTSGIQGKRNVKDIISHITAWNIKGTEWIRSIANDERPLLPMQGYSIEQRSTRFEGLNKEIHELNLDKSIELVLREFRDVLQNLLVQVEQLEDRHLNTVFEFEWMDQQIPGWQIVAWRYYHCESHGKHIESFITESS